MAYETTEVAVSKSQDAIRKLIYAHKGTGVMLISRPPHEGFEAFVEIEKQPYHIRIMATCKDVSHDRKNPFVAVKQFILRRAINSYTPRNVESLVFTHVL